MGGLLQCEENILFLNAGDHIGTDPEVKGVLSHITKSRTIYQHSITRRVFVREVFLGQMMTEEWAKNNKKK